MHTRSLKGVKMLRLKSKIYPRNITITQKQYSTIYENKVPRKINFLFNRKNGVSQPIEDKIAYYLIKTYGVKIYDNGKVLDTKDDLENMHWQDLQKLGREYNKIAGTKNEMWQLKRPEVETKIREWRNDGVKI